MLSIFIAAVALAIASGSERWAGLVPCALCLLERWPYRVAGAIAAVVILVPERFEIGHWLLWLIAATMAASVALSAIHVGVEHGWWPSPLPECAAPSFGGGSIADRLAHMPLRPAKPCDSPTYLIPGLPISMAFMNLMLSLGFGVFLAISLDASPWRHR